MILERITILNFKNIGQTELDFSANINCVVGNNGVGKTNLLDAIYYLSIGKSALGLTDGQCVRHGEDFFMVDGQYTVGDSRENIVCSFRRGASKTLKRNGKEYETMAAHVGLLPIVIVSPQDTALINEAPDDRRRFLNSFLSQIDNNYLTSLVRYNALLAERNKLLKASAGFDDVLEVIDMQMDNVARVVYEKRVEFIAKLSPVVSAYYREISAEREDVKIDYKSDLHNTTLLDLFGSRAEKDRIMGHTTAGIHRDDLHLSILGYPIRKYGSQGQQKSLLVALKLAQYDLIKETKGVNPILLLDDVFDKLDLLRVEELIRLVSSNRFGQIFLTDSNKVRIETIIAELSADHRIFTVDGGEFADL